MGYRSNSIAVSRDMGPLSSRVSVGWSFFCPQKVEVERNADYFGRECDEGPEALEKQGRNIRGTKFVEEVR